jgi:RHS repeat-associated protein
MKRTSFAGADCKTREAELLYSSAAHTGTTECITDAAGTVVWNASYEAYGKLVHENGTVSFKASFTGKQVDEDTGLYYFNARWYDAELGRFVTEDPARDGTNWYEYCRNNPLIYLDPSGLSTTRDDYAYQLRTEGKTAEADAMERTAAEANNGYIQSSGPGSSNTSSQQKSEAKENHSPSEAELSSNRGTEISQNDLSMSYFGTKSIDFHGVYYNGDFLGYGADAEERKEKLMNAPSFTESISMYINAGILQGNAGFEATVNGNSQNAKPFITGASGVSTPGTGFTASAVMTFPQNYGKNDVHSMNVSFFGFGGSIAFSEKGIIQIGLSASATLKGLFDFGSGGITYDLFSK